MPRPADTYQTEGEVLQDFLSLANMVPQDAEHNSGSWRRIERDTRRYIERAKGDVFVFTGPIYEGRVERIRGSGLSIPTAIFKLVYDPGTGKSWAHIQDNSSTARVTAPVSYEKFVQRTGLHLLK